MTDSRGSSEDLTKQLKVALDELNEAKHGKLIELNAEKEKYQTLLHKHTEMEREHTAMKMTLEAKEQECLTLQSHTEIQRAQIQTLQEDIAKMIDKLQDIKDAYEEGIEEKTMQLQHGRD